MALHSSIHCSRLDNSLVLAPERYDPRRLISHDPKSVTLAQIAKVVRKTAQGEDGIGQCLVLDTSDAKEGFVVCRKPQSNSIGSAKKYIEPGDVIVSRLRPYLRQVAFVDDKIPNLNGSILLCSTEFFVLRSADTNSIAFLAPFLLSARVQEVLSASQEGGHHPRFDESTLLGLPIPEYVLSQRIKLNKAFLRALQHYRDAEQTVYDLVQEVDKARINSDSMLI